MGDGSLRWVKRNQILLRNVVSSPAMVVRQAIPERFPARHHAEDYELWAEIVLRAREMVILNEVLAYTYKRPWERRTERGPVGYGAWTVGHVQVAEEEGSDYRRPMLRFVWLVIRQTCSAKNHRADACMKRMGGCGPVRAGRRTASLLPRVR